MTVKSGLIKKNYKKGLQLKTYIKLLCKNNNYSCEVKSYPYSVYVGNDTFRLHKKSNGNVLCTFYGYSHPYLVEETNLGNKNTLKQVFNLIDFIDYCLEKEKQC